MTSLILALNYYENYHNHILYEISITVVNNEFQRLDDVHYVLHKVKNIIDTPYLTNLVSFGLVNKSLIKFIQRYHTKNVWIHGDNKILRNLYPLKQQWVYNIKEATLLGSQPLNIQTLYSEPHYLQKHTQFFPSPMKSITNLCQMLAQNLIQGYNCNENKMYFYLNTNNSENLQCDLHKYYQIHSRCTCILNEINRLTLIFLNRCSNFYNYIIKGYKTEGDIEQYTEQTEKEIEMRLQIILVSLAQPNIVKWVFNVSDWSFSYYIVDIDDNESHAWIRNETKNFANYIYTNREIDHKNTTVMTEILSFLGYSSNMDIHYLP